MELNDTSAAGLHGDRTFQEKRSELNELLEKLSSWMVELKKENPKRINWLECTLEDKIPEYKEWITARRLEEAEGLEQERKIA